MLRLLNEMFELDITTEKLEAYATKLGADCPFFITGRPVYATGIGNEFHPLNLDLSGWYLVVVKPEVFVSTKEAYSMVRPEKPEVTLDKKIIRPITEWKEIISNDFEKGIFALHPELADIKAKLYTLGATYAAMSGSGSALFGLFESPVDDVEQHFPECFCEQQQL
jgi:4-diphosphocytidyl-2-C-methyl-D-erythritol kinase